MDGQTHFNVPPLSRKMGDNELNSNQDKNSTKNYLPSQYP